MEDFYSQLQFECKYLFKMVRKSAWNKPQK